MYVHRWPNGVVEGNDLGIMPCDPGPTMNFVENSVLFFLFDKVDVMNHDDLVSLSASFYSETEIKEMQGRKISPIFYDFSPRLKVCR